jgi:predicted DNA-binding ribbon-helix-helix protein
MDRDAPLGPSRVIKRSVVIDGHKTSVSLEVEFWVELKQIARMRGTTLTDLISKIDAERTSGNLSSALRVYVLRTKGTH